MFGQNRGTAPLMIKFWMCQKCRKMKDYNKKMAISAVE
jgi:hypothetical protein